MIYKPPLVIQMFSVNPYKDGKPLRNFMDYRMYINANNWWSWIVLRSPSRYQLDYLNKLGKNLHKIVEYDGNLQREYEHLAHLAYNEEIYTRYNRSYKNMIEGMREEMREMNLHPEVYKELRKYKLNCFKREGLI